MSDTTPRPDETPGDPTAPAQPADVEVTEFVPVAESAPPPPPPAAPPAYEQPQYAQQQPPPSPQQLPPPAYAGATPGTAVAGPAPISPTEERTWGTLSHAIPAAAMVLTAGTLGFVASLVIYLVYRERGPFVRAHSANSVNIQITAGIVMLISLPLMLVLVGFLTFAAAWVFALVLHVIGAIKANNGEWWTPPLTPQFVK